MIARRTRRRRPAGILIEVLLSVSVFTVIGTFALRTCRSVFTAFERTARRLEAVDLARSKLAELETGLVSVADLEGEFSGDVGSVEGEVSFSEFDVQTGPQWTLEIDSDPSEFRGLTLVALTVIESDEDAASRGEPDTPIEVTIRQLMELRESGPDEYEEDELLEGLPEDGR